MNKEYHTDKYYRQLFDTSQVCTRASVSYQWLLRRVKNDVFNPYAMWGGAYIWTQDDLIKVKERKRHEQFGFIRGAK